MPIACPVTYLCLH